MNMMSYMFEPFQAALGNFVKHLGERSYKILGLTKEIFLPISYPLPCFILYSASKFLQYT